mgnify:CR=1 FL=1
MARLFITPREINFINDIAKEIVKDVIGHKIFYFPISEIKSNVHEIYEESPEKVFENPIELDAIVEYEPQSIRTNQFGSEEYFSIKAYVQSRDLIDKGIDVLEGDFFSFGETFFEIMTAPDSSTLMGQIEYKGFITLSGKQARKGLFLSKVFGPTSEENTDADAVQDTFYQQRGFAHTKAGETGDVRELQKRGILERTTEGPREVSKRGDSSGAGNSFYDEK